MSLTVESKHKPLKMITMKNLISTQTTLQQMLLCLQPYNLVIEYRPGKEMLLSGVMSLVYCLIGHGWRAFYGMYQEVLGITGACIMSSLLMRASY